MKYMLENNHLDGDCLTITGKSLNDNLSKIKPLDFNQKIIKSFANPLKKNGHIRILYGNLALNGSVMAPTRVSIVNCISLGTSKTISLVKIICYD